MGGGGLKYLINVLMDYVNLFSRHAAPTLTIFLLLSREPLRLSSN